MKYTINKLFDRRLILLIATVATALTVSSCNLTRKPTSSLPTDESLENFDDAYAYNAGIMAQFRNRQGGSFSTTQEYMADLINASVDFGNRSGDLHGWIDLSASNDNFATVYGMYYSTMKNVNFTLKNYDHVKENIDLELAETTNKQRVTDLEGQKESIELFKANAHFVRAFYYYNLQLRFGTPYDATTASTDLSVPLVLEFDVSERQTRASVKEVMDQVFKDLDEAQKRLSAVKTEMHEISVDACKALRARIYLEMKEYDKAYTQAMELINSKKYPLVDATNESHEKMWVYDDSTEDILILKVSNPDEQPNGMGSFFGYNRSEHYNAPDFYPTQGLIDMYADNDLRKGFFFLLSPKVRVNSKDYIDKIYVLQKFKGNPDYATLDGDPIYGKVPNGIHRPRVFRIAEQYLIAAEAAYKTGKDATTPLNALRSSRGLEPINASGDVLFKEIQDERTRELLAEGFRLWDLRRWNLPVKRLTPQHPEGITALSDFLAPKGYYDLDIEPGDKLYQRTVWAIPQYDINVYGANVLIQNPGW